MVKLMTLAVKYQERRIFLLIWGSAISIAVMLIPPIYIIENTNLTVRMIADILLFIYAALLGYSLQRYATAKLASSSQTQNSSFAKRSFDALNKINTASKGLIFVMLLPAILLIYWNIPSVFDETAQNIFLRYASDLSYLTAAILAGISLMYVPRRFRIILLYFAFMSAGMSGSMMLVWTPGFYTVYSPVQNTDMNTFLMMFGAFGIIGTSSYLLKAMDVI
jgi:hypothetical protein